MSHDGLHVVLNATLIRTEMLQILTVKLTEVRRGNMMNIVML